MADTKIFPVFCTTDASSELLTTFLLHSAEPFRSGALEQHNANVPPSLQHTDPGSVIGSVILRSPTLSTAESQTPLPIGQLPEPLSPTPFKNWTPDLCLQFLHSHAPYTRVHQTLFIVLDEQSAKDFSCLICEHKLEFADTRGLRTVGRELKAMRTSFRESPIDLCNLYIANMDIEELQEGHRSEGGVSTMEGVEARKKDLEGGVFAEHVLRDGKVVREEWWCMAKC